MHCERTFILKGFLPYKGDLMGLPTNENHLNFIWLEPGCKILFSITQHGNAASCHIASDKNGKPKICQAINEWCEYVFNICDWCKMIVALIYLDSVIKRVELCGFKLVTKINGCSIYVKEKSRGMCWIW